MAPTAVSSIASDPFTTPPRMRKPAKEPPPHMTGILRRRRAELQQMHMLGFCAHACVECKEICVCMRERRNELYHGSVWCERCLNEYDTQEREDLEVYMELMIHAAELRHDSGNRTCVHVCATCKFLYACDVEGITPDHVLLNRTCAACIGRVNAQQ